ncbi:DUF1489 domain-containing protein [Sphingomonas sp. BIUV-7]|uniref:DUF1489 domain-containing protein n=1 Tax=Sphingomonas natans TaxID=3063330 RepID=A0ABT8Y6R1_9SPHN|nr:DUF1489 domain-containing protein [Sphingomonas sp. BIUV-7]MDO6414009.1 DUF1489 domain-containing protein [Sphingomonas sp. BIUV-7]
MAPHIAAVPALHLTKVAVGCSELSLLEARLSGRAEGSETHIVTRYRPTRHAELIGGSLYWIIKHHLVARQTILGFAEEENGHCRIRLGTDLVAIRHRPKRAHQGWRYLVESDAPTDLAGGEDGSDALPPELAGRLATLGLI